MNEQAIKDAYDLFVSNGYSKSIEEFKQLVASNPTARKDAFDLFVSNGYGKQQQDFDILMGAQPQEGLDLKKKEESILPQEQVQSQEVEQSLPWLRQPKQQPKEEKLFPFSESTASTPSSESAKQFDFTEGIQKFNPKTYVAPTEEEQNIYNSSQESTEEKDYFTGAFGNFLRGIDKYAPIGIGDYIDDLSRSVAQGYRSGTAAQEADKLLLQGTKPTLEQIQKFIEAQGSAEQLGESKEMQDYLKTYKEEGEGFWGVVKGIFQNPTIAPQVIASSLTGMATNTDALAAASAALSTGATYGAITGAAFTPEFAGAGVIPGAIAGAEAAIPYAFGVASSVVEMGSTFGELLREQLGDKTFNKENVKAVLENPEKLQSIRNKAIARGLVIGTIDTYTGKLASGVGAKILTKSAEKSAIGAVTKNAVLKSIAAGSGIEAAGGMLGESLGRVAAGQEQDVSEIALEGIGELPGGIRSAIIAKFKKPSYKVNGEKVSASQIDELINTMTPQELTETNIDIKNDYEGRKFKIQDKIVTHSIKEDVRKANPDLNETSLNAITDLEKQLKGLEGNTTQTGKDKSAALRQQIKNIQENQLQEEAINQTKNAVQQQGSGQEIKTGSVIKWDVFGNEEEGDWNVAKETTTRGGQPAVELTKTYVEDSTNGKSYTKEYADKNGIKYDNERTVTHIVPLSEFKTSEAKPQAPAQEVSQEVKDLRAKEKVELIEAIPNIETFRVNGEIDKTNMTPEEEAKYTDIYDKYNELITPLLEEKTSTKEEIVTEESKRQALRDLMEATGDDVYISGVADGTFAGDGLLNLDENGNVILTRHADSVDGLTKGKGKTKNLKDIAGQFGGEQVATSGVEGGLASFQSGTTGEYHIPLQELIQLIKDGSVVFAGLGNKEFVLSPDIADKYLTKIDGKTITKEVVNQVDQGKPKTFFDFIAELTKQEEPTGEVITPITPITQEEVDTVIPPEEQEALDQEIKDLEKVLGIEPTAKAPSLSEETKKDVVKNINKLRVQEKKNNEDNLQETYSIGSDQTIEEHIDEKYDKQLDLFNKISEPAPAPAPVITDAEAAPTAAPKKSPAPVAKTPTKTTKFETVKSEQKQNETERRNTEQGEIDRRPNKGNNVLSKLLAKYSRASSQKRGVNKRNIREVKRLGKFDVNVKAEYTLDSKINEALKKIFPKFQGVQKIYEITDGAIYRKMMVAALKNNKFASSVTVHSAEDFNGMRMFVTEDGSTGLTLNKEGFVGAGFSTSNRPNNLTQLMILAIKEGGTTIEAFDTVLPDYYSLFGFKAVSRTGFNDEYRPLKKNKNTTIDWDYDTYKDYNGGKPDVVFFIYDGGDRNTIEDRIGQFESYSKYEKKNTKSFSKDEYDSAEEVMKQEAVKRMEYETEKKSVPEYTSKTQQPLKTVDELKKEYKEKITKVKEDTKLSPVKKQEAIDNLKAELSALRARIESQAKEKVEAAKPKENVVDYEYSMDAESATHESNMDLLSKTIKKNKIKPGAEPIITIIKGKVLVEYNNFDNKNSVTKLIFNQDKDGKWSSESIKIERIAIPIRETVFFENYINPQFRTEEVTTAQQVEDIPSNMVLTGNEKVVKGDNMPTVNLGKEKFNDDYSFDDMMSRSYSRTATEVGLAEKVAKGEMQIVEENEKGEKVKSNIKIPYINKIAAKKIAKLKNEIAAIKGSSKEAIKEKNKKIKELNNVVKSVLNDLRNVMAQNVLALYDSLTEDFVSRSKEWYVGANRMANAIANAYDISVNQMSGIIAVLSPQNDWFNNVSLAERTVEVLSKHSDTIVSQDIFDKAMQINSKNKKSQFTPLLKVVYAKYGNMSLNDMQSIGASLDEQSIYLRAIDQALYSNKVLVTSPSGKYLGVDTVPVRWASSAMVSSAIAIYRDGSSENINLNLGNGNKVRNFYNNIADPNSKTPYVTADTHALSVAMNLPISAKIATDFGIFGGGNNPLYALVKTAYIDAANIAGVLPREMQSVTWEAQRTGVNDKNRTAEQKNKNFLLVEELRQNEQTPYERATTIISRNRSKDPIWGQSDRVVTQRTGDTIVRELESRANERASDVSSVRGEQPNAGRTNSTVDNAIAKGQTNSTEEVVTQYVGNDLPKIFQLIARLQEAFPNVIVSVDTETFNNILSSPGVRTFVSDGVVIYGVTINGDIYINPDVHKSESDLFNTSIHEFGHVWQDFLSTTEEGKRILEKGYSLIKEAVGVDPYITSLYNTQLAKFNGNETKALNEVASILIGNKGAEVVNKSVSERIKDWLSDVWNYISSAFKMSSELTEQDIENMTLDQFIGTALADMLSGKEITMSDSQLKQLKNPEAAFSSSQNIFDIVTTGRQSGFSDASIKAVLLNRGFKPKEIDAVMQVNLNLFDKLPPKFANVEGGINVGMDLFNQTLNKLIEFQKAYGYKSMAEIRQKALELLKSNPIFQKQTDQIQKELTVAFDKTLNTKANKDVNAMIAGIKNDLRQRKIGADNLLDSQIQLRTLIRNLLPKSNQYTQADINKLIKLVNETTVDNFRAKAEIVFDIVEKQQEKIRKNILSQIYKLVMSKAQAAKTTTGKRRSKGLDAQGQLFFEAAKQVLKAVYNNDTVALANIAEEISDTEAIDNILVKSLIEEVELTTQEQRLLDKATAFDSFSDLMGMNIEQLTDVFNSLKEERAASIVRLKENRKARALMYKAIIDQANDVVLQSHPILFTTVTDEEGNAKTEPKTQGDLDADKDEIWNYFNKLKLWEATKKFAERWQYDSLPKIFGFFRSTIANIEFFVNLYDKTSQYFKENIYDKLNKLNEEYNKGYFKEMDHLDMLANSIDGINKGYKQIRKMLEIGIHEFQTTRRISNLNGNQLLRIYALSKNDIQRAKLKKMGFGDQEMQRINDLLPKEAREFADKVVQYFSTSYYESVNSIYSYLNDVNLQYVPNYFPTITESKSVGAQELLDGNFNGIFNAENAPALKERSDTQADIDILKDFTSVVESHFQAMEKYKSFAFGVKQLNALFQSRGFINLMEETGTKSLFKNLINQTINPNGGMKVPSSFMDKLYTKYSGFALAYKAIQLPKQLTAFIFAYQNYQFLKKTKVPGLDAIMFMLDNAKVMATLPAQFRKAKEISATFRDRVAKGIEGDVFGLESGSSTYKKQSEKNTLMGRLVRGFKNAGAAPTIAGDLLSVMSYMAVYNRNIANGMSPEQALLEFNNFNATLQTRRGTEKSTLQTSQSVATRAFTMFGSTAFLQLNGAAIAAKNIARDISNKQAPSQTDIRRFVISFGAANFLFVLVSNIGKLINGDDDDKEEVERGLMDALLGLNLIYQIPIVGSGVEQMVSKARGERKPIEGMVNPIGSVMRKINKGLESGDWVDGVRPIAEIGIGAQLDPLIALYSGATDEFDENTVYDLMGISQSYRPKPPSKSQNTEYLKQEQQNQDISNFGMTREELKKLNPDMYKIYFPEEVNVNGNKKEMLSPPSGYVSPGQSKQSKNEGYIPPKM
jgi:hypothetical protein